MKNVLLTALLSGCCTLLSAQTFQFGTSTAPDGRTFQVDSRGFIIDGHHQLPVMGEIHYARVPRQDWRREICKMRAGGINIVATYCFWIHHEYEEGQWDWSGNRDLHHFLEICKEEGMPVVLRVGPFCHGEVYQGGFPDWLVSKSIDDPKQYKLRSLAPGFMAATQRLYSNIFAQASDMLWKHGGPVVGVQIENECRGPWSYYMALKEMAVSIGFDTPFYTRTGWPKLNGKEEFGKMLPLYGDYADGFWDRKLTDMPGEYPAAFVMKDTRLSAVIATETFGNNQDTHMEQADLQYPYLTCELGGGMMTSYHRRLNMSGHEPLPLAICKVGSGSNLPGYYMYHGGTNPSPRLLADGSWDHSMAEMQDSRTTAHNDLPYMSYDFQCPLGEMGQPNENAFHETRWLHQMLADWGEELSQMDVDSLSEHYARRGSFVFRNDYVRLLNENGTASVTPHDLTLADGLVVNGGSVQPFARTDEGYFFITTDIKKPPYMIINGKRYTMRFDVPRVINGKSFTVLSPAKARTAFVIDHQMHYAQHGGILYRSMTDQKIVEECWEERPTDALHLSLIREAGPLRTVKMGNDKVAEQPSNADFEQAAIYRLDIDTTALLADITAPLADITAPLANGSLAPDGNHPWSNPNLEDAFLQISYRGDVARVYADGRLVADNFWNGKPMLVRLSSLVGKKVELRILPLAKDAPIYLQQPQRAILDAAPDSGLLSLDAANLIVRTLYHE